MFRGAALPPSKLSILDVLFYRSANNSRPGTTPRLVIQIVICAHVHFCRANDGWYVRAKTGIVFQCAPDYYSLKHGLLLEVTIHELFSYILRDLRLVVGLKL